MIRLAAATVTIILLAPAGAAGQTPDQPTFVDDVAPILHAHSENPDPTVDVTWGLESTDEMLNGLVDYVAVDR